MLIEITLCLIAFILTIYLYLRKDYGYWEKKGVDYIKPKFPLGIVHDQFFGIRDAGATNQIYYTHYKKQDLKYVGTFLLHIPGLIVFDLDLCKQLLTKDFNHFVNRDFTPTTHEYISKHLFALEGEEWRTMRTKLSPTFTSGKMKNMFPLLNKCSQQLQEYIDDVVLEQGSFGVKDLIIRFTTDVIASCAFGLEINCIKHPDNEFFGITKLVFEPKKSVFFNVLMQKIFPRLCKFLGINFYHPKITQVLTKVMKDNVQYRKEAGIKRNDFIDILLEVKDKKATFDHHSAFDQDEAMGVRDKSIHNTAEDNSKYTNLL